MTNESEGAVTKVLKKVEMDYPVARVEHRGVFGAYRVTGVPWAWLIDREGQVAWYGHPSKLTEEKIEALLE